MKKLAFVFTFAISIMLFSCTSDSNDSTVSADNKLTEAANIAQTDSLNQQLDKTSKAINLHIQSLNDAEADLMKEFDLK